MNTNSLLRGRTARGMARRQQLHDAVLKEIIREEIIIDQQRHELAALATLMLVRAKEEEEDESSNTVWKNLHQDLRRPSD